ncbi:MAG: 6-carboxy-5,6,7,8-tetrahydropterin synthase [Gammaproteobacteria bacterium]|nr:6-carboxy-5,6,7,8-tetrahydropterin synthase [Gammaproteobacteria bacterium]
MVRSITGCTPMRIYKQFQIEAAHLLPYLPTEHKCRRLHGHSFKISVHIEGALDIKLGWVMDYADIGKAFQPIFDQIDHQYLNDIAGLENPTSENLAKWIWRKLQDALPNLVAVYVNETCTSGCIYEGDD